MSNDTTNRRNIVDKIHQILSYIFVPLATKALEVFEVSGIKPTSAKKFESEATKRIICSRSQPKA